MFGWPQKKTLYERASTSLSYFLLLAHDIFSTRCFLGDSRIARQKSRHSSVDAANTKSVIFGATLRQLRRHRLAPIPRQGRPANTPFALSAASDYIMPRYQDKISLTSMFFHSSTEKLVMSRMRTFCMPAAALPPIAPDRCASFRRERGAYAPKKKRRAAASLDVLHFSFGRRLRLARLHSFSRTIGRPPWP